MTRKAINDEFTRLQVTRQYRYMLRHMAKGLCRLCSQKAVNRSHCEKHRVMYNKMTLKAIKRRQKEEARQARKILGRFKHGAK